MRSGSVSPLAAVRLSTFVPSSTAIPLSVSVSRLDHVGPTRCCLSTGAVIVLGLVVLGFVVLGLFVRGLLVFGLGVVGYGARRGARHRVRHLVVHVVHAGGGEAEVFCGALREVELAPTGVRAAVVNYDIDRAAGVADGDLGPKRQRVGGGRVTVGVEDLSARGELAVEARPVSGSKDRVGLGPVVAEGRKGPEDEQNPKQAARPEQNASPSVRVSLI